MPTKAEKIRAAIEIKTQQLYLYLHALNQPNDEWEITGKYTKGKNVLVLFCHPTYGQCNSLPAVARKLGETNLDKIRDLARRAVNSAYTGTPPPRALDLTQDSDSECNDDSPGAEEATCGICFCATSRAERVRLTACQHDFCAGCLGTYLSGDAELLLHPTLHQPRCPSCAAERADGLVQPEHVRRVRKCGCMTEAAELRLDAAVARRVLGAELYGCIKCTARFVVEPPDEPAAANPYEARCPTCRTHQCVKCAVEWATHIGLSCEQMQVRLAPMDEATRRMLEGEGAVPCPGTCGHGLTKVGGAQYCNVLRCGRCRLYVCALCGAKLDSAEFSETDREHRRASAHYAVKGSRCVGALFMPRAEWLARQGLAAPAVAAAAEAAGAAGGQRPRRAQPAAAEAQWAGEAPGRQVAAAGGAGAAGPAARDDEPAAGAAKPQAAVEDDAGDRNQQRGRRQHRELQQPPAPAAAAPAAGPAQGADDPAAAAQPQGADAPQGQVQAGERPAAAIRHHAVGLAREPHPVQRALDTWHFDRRWDRPEAKRPRINPWPPRAHMQGRHAPGFGAGGNVRAWGPQHRLGPHGMQGLAPNPWLGQGPQAPAFFAPQNFPHPQQLQLQLQQHMAPAWAAQPMQQPLPPWMQPLPGAQPWALGQPMAGQPGQGPAPAALPWVLEQPGQAQPGPAQPGQAHPEQGQPMPG